VPWTQIHHDEDVVWLMPIVCNQVIDLKVMFIMTQMSTTNDLAGRWKNAPSDRFSLSVVASVFVFLRPFKKSEKFIPPIT